MSVHLSMLSYGEESRQLSKSKKYLLNAALVSQVVPIVGQVDGQ